MRVVDDFLPNPCRIRREALRAPFVDWEGPDGQVYKRVCLTAIPGVLEGIEQVYGPVQMHGMGYRLNYAGEPPNAAIHSDLGWGTHAMVLYLCNGPGGTAFWKHRATGAERIRAGDADLLEQVQGDWDNADAWEQTGLCEVAFNRAVMYESERFHSRWPFEAFGDCPATGRLIAVAFFTPEA